MDSPFIPRQGYLLRSRFEIWDKNLASTEAFPLAELDLSWAKPVSRPGSILLQAQGGTVFGRDRVAGLPIFALGGVSRLSAYGANEFLTAQYFLLRANYLHELGRLPVFAGKRILAVAGYELGKAYGNQVSRLPNNAAVGLAVETLIGPVFIGGAVGDGGRRKIYFQIGRLF
jgi:NTE family protein